MGDKVYRTQFDKTNATQIGAIKFFTGAEWFDSLSKSDYANMAILVNANDLSDESIEKVEEAKKRAKHDVTVLYTKTGRSTIDERGARQYQMRLNAEQPYEHFATIRNMVIDHVVRMAMEDHSIKYFVSADSDVITHPDAIPRLVEIMENNPDIGICSIPVNNDRRVAEKRPYGLGWGQCQYNFGEWILFTEGNPRMSNVRPTTSFPINSGVRDVGYTGAFCIIRTSLLMAPQQVRYASHIQGEDVPFCHAVKDAGYRICVDTDQVSLHLQDPRLFSRDRQVFERRELI